MKFSSLLFWSLLGPVMLVSVPDIYSLIVMWGDPGLPSASCGIGVLLASLFFYRG